MLVYQRVMKNLGMVAVIVDLYILYNRTTPLDGHATYVKQLAACYLPAKPKGSVGNPLVVWGGSHWLSFGHKS